MKNLKTQGFVCLFAVLFVGSVVCGVIGGNKATKALQSHTGAAIVLQADGTQPPPTPPPPKKQPTNTMSVA